MTNFFPFISKTFHSVTKKKSGMIKRTFNMIMPTNQLQHFIWFSAITQQ